MEKTELRKVSQLAWRRLIASEHGQEGLLVLRESAPVIVKGDPHTIIYDAGRVSGFNEAIDAIYKLASAGEDKHETLDNP